MVDLGRFISETNIARTSDEAFGLLEKALAELGFDRIVYSLLTDHPHLNKKRQHGIVRSYPEDWMKYYFAQGYMEIDPVIKLVKQYNGPFLWADMHRFTPMGKREQTLMNEAEEAGVREGIGIALHGPNAQIVGMGAASSAGGVEMGPDTLSLVHLLCTQFNHVYQKLEREAVMAEQIITLSDRECEILTWLAVGKSQPVIGEILGISEHTVKTYLQRVFTKLGVRTRQEAIVHAIRLGLITPELSEIAPVTR